MARKTPTGGWFAIVCKIGIGAGAGVGVGDGVGVGVGAVEPPPPHPASATAAAAKPLVKPMFNRRNAIRDTSFQTRFRSTFLRYRRKRMKPA